RSDDGWPRDGDRGRSSPPRRGSGRRRPVSGSRRRRGRLARGRSPRGRSRRAAGAHDVSARSAPWLANLRRAGRVVNARRAGTSGGIDAFFTSLHVEKKRFWKAGWYHPLNKFLADPTLTSPDFDWNDFTPGARAGVTQPDGSISAFAAFVDANVVFYRKDLFGPKGLTPPKTLADLEPLVKKLHAPPGTY